MCGIGLGCKVTVTAIAQRNTEAVESNVLAHLCKQTHTLGIVHARVLQGCVLTLCNKDTGGWTLIGAHCNDTARYKACIVPRRTDDTRLNLLDTRCAYTDIACCIDDALCIALEGNTPTGNELPIAAIDHKTSIVDSVVYIWCNTVCYVTIRVLKDLDLCNLWHTCINGNILKFAVLATYHCNRQHTTVHLEHGLTIAGTAKGEITAALKSNSHTFWIVLVVVAHIVLAHIGTVGKEIVLTAIEQQSSRISAALSLYELDCRCNFGSHILASTRHDTEIECAVHLCAISFADTGATH